MQEKSRIFLKAGDKIVRMVAEFGIVIIDVWNVWSAVDAFNRSDRPHSVGIRVNPCKNLLSKLPIIHSADREDIVVWRSAEGGKQTDHHDRIGNDFRGGFEGLRLGIDGCSFLGRSLQDQFNVDRRRMITACDEVFLMHVRGGEAMKERQPRAGTSEKTLDSLLIVAAGMVDEFDPAIAVARDRTRRFELHWSA